MYSSVAAGDHGTAMNLLSPDLVINEPSFFSYGGVYRGLSGMQDLMGRFGQLADMSGLQVERLVADDDHVFAVLRIPALGGDDEILLAEESVIRDEKIICINVYAHEARPLL